MLALAAALAGCGSGADDAAGAEPLILPPVYADDAFRGTHLDTVRYSLAPFVFGARVAGEDTVWAIDYVWLTLGSRPGEVFTPYQMQVLEEQGVVDTTTAVGFVSYRVRITAANPDRVIREAASNRPQRTPPKLIEAVQAAAAAQQAPPPEN